MDGQDRGARDTGGGRRTGASGGGGRRDADRRPADERSARRSPVEDTSRPLFMISVAAELADMHPQTLRMYERRGLVCPSRSAKQTRLYSMADVERLRYIQRLVSDVGLNLAGVERVLELEGTVDEMHRRVRELEAELEAAMERAQHEIDRVRSEVEEVHRSYRRELVPVVRGEIVVRRASGRR